MIFWRNLHSSILVRISMSFAFVFICDNERYYFLFFGLQSSNSNFFMILVLHYLYLVQTSVLSSRRRRLPNTYINTEGARMGFPFFGTQFVILNSGKCELECIKFNSLLHWELQTASHKPTAVWIPCLESLCFVCLLLFIDHNVCSTTFMQRFLMKPEYFRHRDNYGLQTTDSDFTHSQFINIPLWIAEVEHKTYTGLFFVLFC